MIDSYRRTLRELQIELVKLQRHMIAHDYKILVVLEGRDAAGKDGAIKRIVEHLSPRETRVVALGKPSDRDRSSWYFQRYVPHLPAADEFVLFNRSWYNRAGVERVMKFCTPIDYEEFMSTVLDFERMLVGSGIRLIKYYLDISKAEQKKRLAERRKDPLKQWKISPIDAQATRKWKAYSQARNEMLMRTHCPLTPWTIVRSDDKKQARLGLIRDLLSRLPYDDKKHRLLKADPRIVFPFSEARLHDGTIAP
ncbi:MAG: polyphosphate kinase 2 [Alphaproteobacteria bacterium]|nr:polyphosphate kinase 2 [Alphaproteobacteria bacterium]